MNYTEVAKVASKETQRVLKDCQRIHTEIEGSTRLALTTAADGNDNAAVAHEAAAGALREEDQGETSVVEALAQEATSNAVTATMLIADRMELNAALGAATTAAKKVQGAKGKERVERHQEAARYHNQAAAMLRAGK
jgi:hypothetical protein